MMWPSDEYFWAVKAIKEKEILEHVHTRMASKPMGGSAERYRPRIWQWRVGSGLEAAFHDRLLWFLPRCHDIAAEPLAAKTGPPALPPCALARCCW